MTNILTAKDLTVSYGEACVLSKVSLTLDHDEFLGLVGPNGAGKSTLLKAISGLVSLDDGAVQLGDQGLSSLTSKQLAERIAHVPQAFEFANTYSVYDFVALSRFPYLSPFRALSNEDEGQVQIALELTEIDKLKDRSLLQLSGGERQRVLIAAALAQEADILLLDEPTTYLDPYHQLQIVQTIRNIRSERSVSIIAATHDLSLLEEADSVVALSQGELQFHGQATEFMSKERLSALYGADFDLFSHPSKKLPIPVLLHES